MLQESASMINVYKLEDLHRRDFTHPKKYKMLSHTMVEYKEIGRAHV